MTPDELRAQIRTLWSLDYCNDRCVEVVDAAADAWKADRKRLEAAEGNVARMENDTACIPEDYSVSEYVASLRKRLEAAETEATRLRARLSGASWSGHAALAGEEKP